MSLFNDTYKNKKVLITGNTGFKGSWLSAWLISLGADVYGFSVDIPSKPSNHDICEMEKRVTQYWGDIRDYDKIKNVIEEIQPDIVFHLAAQAITRLSYEQPVYTMTTNAIGTMNVLDCLRNLNREVAAVFITSDKCYHNVEWEWGYRETDRLGGEDIYSASKACAEIIIQSYYKSFFEKKGKVLLASVRAGNVIGGGDWAKDRIVPDCIKSFNEDKTLQIRNPHSTRPWQLVLEPLSGYLWLGSNLLEKKIELSGHAFNFGPLSDVNRTVEELLVAFQKEFGKGDWECDDKERSIKKEANLLKLCCDKSLHHLGWSAVLMFEQTVQMTADWYKKCYSDQSGMFDYSVDQIKNYVGIAKELKIRWAE